MGKDDKSIETYGLNAVCTHLGCVVPCQPPITNLCAPVTVPSMLLTVMLYVDQHLFHSRWLTAQLVKTVKLPFRPGPRLTSVQRKNHGGCKLIAALESTSDTITK